MPLPDEDALKFEKDAFADDIGMLYGVEKVGGFEAMRVREISELLRYLLWQPRMPKAARHKFLNFLNVKFNITAEEGSIVAHLEERKEALERAFLVPTYLHLERGEIWERIMLGNWSPEDSVLLEVRPPSVSPQKMEEIERAVKWLGRSPEEEILQVSTPEAAFLVISEAFYPGWKAAIDGKPTEIYRANFAFRAVAIPAGRHTVTFSYRPLSFKIGAWVSIATLALIIAGFIYMRIKRRSVGLVESQTGEAGKDA